MRPAVQASAAFISLLLLLLFSFGHLVYHNVSITKRGIPAFESTPVTPDLRIESSRIAKPFGDRHAHYRNGLLSNRTHSEKRIAKRESIW